MEYFSSSAQKTKEIAKQFAATLHAGDIVELRGDLGAGKTEFAKGVVEYFGGGTAVSPTFNIVNEYKCKNITIYHFDFYRIKDISELIAIGIEEYLFSGAICLIEWPERAEELLDGLNIKTVLITKTENGRKIDF